MAVLPEVLSPESLTADFLSQLVGEAHPGVSVEEVRLVGKKSFGEVNVSTSGRASLEVKYCQGAPNHLPTRLLAKMSMGVADEIWCGHLDILYEDEIEFYRRLRPELRIELPQSVGGVYDPVTRRYVLLLEDMTARGAHFGSQADDVGVEHVKSGIDTYAKLHAQYWNSPRFQSDLAWVPNQIDGRYEEKAMRIDCFNGIREELGLHKYKRELIQQLGTTADEMFKAYQKVRKHFLKYPQTLLHGDSHLGNTYRLPDGTVGINDLQCFATGFGVYDISYFMTTCLSIELRRANERSLLAYYREKLQGYGISDPPSLDEMWHAHRLQSMWSWFMGWMTVPVANYGWDLLVLALLRTSTAFKDLDTLEAVRALG
jgi:hypothetical protein